MFQVIGKVGTVVGVTESGDLKVRYTTENLVCTLCAEAVVKVYICAITVFTLNVFQ